MKFALYKDINSGQQYSFLEFNLILQPNLMFIRFFSHICKACISKHVVLSSQLSFGGNR